MEAKQQGALEEGWEGWTAANASLPESQAESDCMWVVTSRGNESEVIREHVLCPWERDSYVSTGREGGATVEVDYEEVVTSQGHDLVA